MSTKNVLIGTLAGLAAGAVLGILYAPHKGSVTRKKITRKSNEYAEDIKEKMDEMIDKVSDKYEEVIKEADKLADNIRHRTEKILHKN